MTFAGHQDCDDIVALFCKGLLAFFKPGSRERGATLSGRACLPTGLSRPQRGSRTAPQHPCLVGVPTRAPVLPQRDFRGWRTGLSHRLPKAGPTGAAAHLRTVARMPAPPTRGRGVGRLRHRVWAASRRAFGAGCGGAWEGASEWCLAACPPRLRWGRETSRRKPLEEPLRHLKSNAPEPRGRSVRNWLSSAWQGVAALWRGGLGQAPDS
jgi:hypothetical protein